jgi:hypothetical protein
MLRLKVRRKFAKKRSLATSCTSSYAASDAQKLNYKLRDQMQSLNPSSKLSFYPQVYTGGFSVAHEGFLQKCDGRFLWGNSLVR